MALDTSPQNLHLEIGLAETARDKRLYRREERIRSYATPFHSSLSESEDSPEYDPENILFEFHSHMMSVLVYNNPTYAASSRSESLPAKVRATSMKYAMNRWARDVDLQGFLQAPATDVFFDWAVVMVSPEPNPAVRMKNAEGFEDVMKLPVLTRVSPRDYIVDPQAYTPGEARFEGHRWKVDKDDLLRWAREDDEKWNLDVIESLVESNAERPERATEDEAAERREVTCYTVWVPQDEHEDGEDDKHHGTIYTLGVTGGKGGQIVDFIRPPAPFHGPRGGPYAVCSVYTVPDDPFGLSPFTAIEGQRRELNALARGINRRAMRSKRVVLVDEHDAGLSEKIRDAEDNLVINVRGLDKNKVMEVQVGGVTAEDYGVLEYLRARLERMIGLTDAQRGAPRGGTTATEAAIADEASDRRTDFIRLQFHRFVRRISEIAAWYIDQSEDVEFPLSEEAAGELREMGIDIPEGMPLTSRTVRSLPGIPDIPFEDLELDIEPMSMTRMSEGLRRQQVTEVFQLIAQIAQLAPAAPWVRWDRLVGMVGESFNIAGLEDLIDMQGVEGAARQMEMLQAQEMQAKMQPKGAERPKTGVPGNTTGAKLAAANRG